MLERPSPRMKDFESVSLLLDENEVKNVVVSEIHRKDFSDRRKKIILGVGAVVLCSLFVFASQTDFIVFDKHLSKTQQLISSLGGPSSTATPDLDLPSPTPPFSSSTNISDVCIHPKIDKFDPDIMKYYVRPPVCFGLQKKNLTTLVDGRLVNNEPTAYDCWGRCLWYKSNKENKEGDWKSTGDNYTFDCDIIQANCSRKGQPITQSYYGHLHTQIVERPLPQPKYRPTVKQYSVYFITVDSHAYTQHFRNLPNTNEFLMKEMEAITFPYLNRVADRSRENAIPWWFGKLTEPIDRSRYNLTSFTVEPKWAKTANCKRQLDNETMLIKEFGEYGYVTNLAEDWWGCMDYECAGFKDLVGLHTYWPYVLEYEKNKKLREWLEKKQCLHRHQHLLDYDSQFIQAYKGKPKMLWTWLVHIGHNTEYLSKELDPHLLDFFKKNKEELENSFVFLGGDHGLRNSDAVKSRIGKYDVNNPLLMMTLPKDLRTREDLVKTIRENAEELQTHFDTRATLLDILKYQPPFNFESRAQMDIPGELGHSFMRKQPKPRNCRTLPILPQFCICESPLNVNLVEKDMNRTTRIGQRIIDSINKKLKDSGLEDKCKMWNYTGVEQLTLVSETPVNVQGIVMARTDNQTSATAQFKIFGSGKDDSEIETVSLDRLDRYGNSGDCAPKDFRPFCVCR